MFLDCSDLGSLKHQTDAEVKDAFRICKGAVDKYKTPLASIDVDNAARPMASRVASRFKTQCGQVVLVLRDPSHCVDLCSKDLALTNVVKHVLADCKVVRDFVKIDRIDSIRLEDVRDGCLEYDAKAVDMVSTRMNLVHDYLLQTRKQYAFTQLVSENPKFQMYYKERTTATKTKLDLTLERCRQRDIWLKMDMLSSNLTCHFKQVHQLCSREDFPLSAYPILVQGLRNDINRGLTSEFDAVLGEGARAEIVGMVSERFNMDGLDPSGRKVGLLDRHHLMAFLCDPFGHEWRSIFKIQTNLAVLVREMIDLFVPLDDEGLSTSRKRILAKFMVSKFNFCIVRSTIH